MKLTMHPVGWSSDGPASLLGDEDVMQYEVRGGEVEHDCLIRATTTPQGVKTWSIVRDGQAEGTKYATAQAALEALNAEM